jgi:hypothetical protein
MQTPLTALILQNRVSENVSVYLEARIDPEGDLLLSGHDVGRTVKECWGDSDYEYFLEVKKADKEKVPPLLLRERFSSMPEFLKWAGGKNIPVRADWDGRDFETFLDAHTDYRDTVLLWLLQERFSTMSEFMAWLDEKKIPNKFFSYA